MPTEARQISFAPRLLLAKERNRVAFLFAGDITTFHRKSYANLSAAPNKAMNLNAYIGLLGGRYSIAVTGDSRRLHPVSAEAVADLAVPATDYVMTLDADSLVMPDYLMTLV